MRSYKSVKNLVPFILIFLWLLIYSVFIQYEYYILIHKFALWQSDDFLFQFSLAWSPVLHFCVQIKGQPSGALAIRSWSFFFFMFRSWPSIAILLCCINDLKSSFLTVAIRSWSLNVTLIVWDHYLCYDTITLKSWSSHPRCHIEIIIFIVDITTLRSWSSHWILPLWIHELRAWPIMLSSWTFLAWSCRKNNFLCTFCKKCVLYLI